MKISNAARSVSVLCLIAGALSISGSLYAADTYSNPTAGPNPGAAAKEEANGSTGAVVSSKVSFKNLKDGDVVKSPFKVVMSVTGLKVRNAGEDANDVTSGHHHIIVDGGPIKAGDVVPPNDATHFHYGKGQTEAELTLPPGHHKLTLQFADGAHRSYGEALSSTIHITVKN